MNNLKVVDYAPSYAKAIAEMWRRSSEGWNGAFGTETEESVQREHETMSNTNTWLMLNGEEVVGYCGYSKYAEDEGAMYIRLLNVRYDCHGMGIGKLLVLKSVERTIELGWPRLDLYTWPGNTKSVPLYKKCGFFLEKRDEVTHLMNFIPTVMTTEAVADFFAKADWYGDMKRNIDMEPDGRFENGFDFYEYLWEKEGKSLRMEFERKGRGLRCIETEDYCISLSLPAQDLVFGKSYTAAYEIVNKSGKPLTVTLKGMDDKNISCSYEKTVEVEEKELIEGEFYVGSIKEEYGSFKTHPAVVSEVIINGKKALFRLGIAPKCPAKILLSNPVEENYKGVPEKLYLDIENNFKEEAVFKFSIPSMEAVKFDKESFELRLGGKEKKSIELTFTMKQPSFYNANIKAEARLSSGESIDFEVLLTALLKGREGCFGGENEKYAVIVNGPYSVRFDKEFNETYIMGSTKDHHRDCIKHPQLGKPYSLEFSSAKPESVKYYKDGQWIVLEIVFDSQEKKGIKTSAVTRLSGSGLVEHWLEVYNASDYDSNEELWLNEGIHFNMIGGTIPYDGKFLQISETPIMNISAFDIEKINENWIFAGGLVEMARGLVWDKEQRLTTDGRNVCFEHSLGRIPAGGRVVSRPIYIGIDSFKTWQELRAFALGKKDRALADSIEDLEIAINSGNPFVEDNFTVNIMEHKLTSLNGTLSVKSGKGTFEKLSKQFGEEERIKETSFEIAVKERLDMDIITTEIDLSLLAFERSSALFIKKGTEINDQTIEDKGKTVYSANNGIMEIKACPDFSNGIYSLSYKGQQWMDSAFPEAHPRTWFNPWLGGMYTVPRDFSGRTIKKEKIDADYGSLKDNMGNEWKGLSVSLSIRENEDFKGLELCGYFLMLPGVPVLLHMVELMQGTGSFMKDIEFVTMNFFNIDSEKTNNWIKVKNKLGKMTKYKAGREACDIEGASSMLYGCDSIDTKLQIFTRFEEIAPVGFINTHDYACVLPQNITAEKGERFFTKPVFYIFTEDYIEDDLLKNLRNIKF